MLNTEQGEDLVLIHDGVLEFLETKYLENMSNCPGDHSDITDLESCMCRLEYTEIKLHLLFSFFLGERLYVYCIFILHIYIFQCWKCWQVCKRCLYLLGKSHKKLLFLTVLHVLYGIQDWLLLVKDTPRVLASITY